MTSSLVGSEMCIRDRCTPGNPTTLPLRQHQWSGWGPGSVFRVVAGGLLSMFSLLGGPSRECDDGVSYPAAAPVERVGTSKRVSRSGKWSALCVLTLGWSFP
eukprot:9030056-Prorocentrum_lima.AAC.1